MSKIQSHANCFHAATKADRARCRKARAENNASLREQANEIIASYYGNSADADEVTSALGRIFGFEEIGYHEDIDVEEIVARAAALAAQL
jgi:hypothetical protein